MRRGAARLGGQRVVTATVVAVLAVFGLAVAPANAAFDDVPPGQYYTAAVDWMADQAITTGTSPTTFEPLTQVNRAQFATFLWRFAGEPAAPASSFADVPAGAFYEDAVNWMASTGITTGTSPTTFEPLTLVNRAQAATFFWRYMCEPTAPASSFADVVAGSFYEDAVGWMASTGITTGTSPTTFEPLTVLNRAQAATFMHRLAGEPAVGAAGANRSYTCGVVAGTSTLAADMDPVTFDSTAVGSSTTKTVTLTNNGTAGDPSISVSSIALADTTDGITIATAPTLPLTLAPGEQASVKISFGPVRVGSSATTLTVEHDGSNPPLNIALSGQGVPSIAYRVNAGGPEIAGTPVWNGDAKGSPATEHGLTGGADKTTVSGDAIDVSDSSIPAGTPSALFSDDRFDNSGGDPMNWDIAVANGTYLVRLYFAELYHTSDGARAFDVAIEGDTVLKNYDIHADVGHDAGVVKTYVVTVADGGLDVDFAHVEDNPAISAIEVLGLGSSAAGHASASPTFKDFGGVPAAGASDSATITVQNLGVAGDASVTITAVVTGGDFSDDFSSPVVLAPGTTTTFDVTFDPSTTGPITGQALVHTDGAVPVIPVGLSGFGTEGTGATVRVNTKSENIDESTFTAGSFKVQNTSASATITDIDIDLSTAIIPGVVFDEADGSPAGDQITKDFTVDISPGSGSAVLGDPYHDGDRLLQIDYAAGVFEPGETLAFSIDIDPVTIEGATAPGPHEAGSVSGFELTGATVTIEFSDATTLVGRLFGDGSTGGGELVLVDETAPIVPVIAIGANASGSTVATASHTVLVTSGAGNSGFDVELLQVEVGLYTHAGAPAHGPADGNSAIVIDYTTSTLSAGGTASFPVVLATSTVGGNENPGLNYFIVKVTDPSTGRTSVSDVFILDYNAP